MRYLLPLIILASATFVTAQNPPPPPPPAPSYFKAPAPSEIKTFKDEEELFAIDFAGNVRTNVEESGQFSIRNYEARREATLSKVIIYDFGVSSGKKLDQDGFIEDLKSDLLRVRGSTILSEEKYEFGGYPFVDIESGDSMFRTHTRVIFRDSKIFRLHIDITNWHMYRGENRGSFIAEKTRFFNSLKFYEPTEPGPRLVPRIDLEPKVAADPDGWALKKFDEGRYSVLMPSEPEEEIEPLQIGPFSTQLKSYTSEGESQIYSLGFMNFGFEISDPVEIEGFFDSWEEGLMETISDPKLEKRNIDFQGRKARRSTVSNEVLRLDGIALYIEGRMVQMFVVGPSAGFSNEEMDENLRLIEKFFDSFGYSSLKTASAVPEQKPEFIKEGTIFKSEKYGFEIELPAGWQHVEKTRLQQAMKSTEEDRAVTPETKSNLRWARERSEMLFGIVTRFSANVGQASLVCGLESIMNVENADPGSRLVVLASYDNFQRYLGYEGVSPPELTQLGGTSFYVFRLRKSVNGVTLNQVVYMKREGNYLMQFVLTYDIELLLKEMEKTLKTLKFSTANK